VRPQQRSEIREIRSGVGLATRLTCSNGVLAGPTSPGAAGNVAENPIDVSAMDVAQRG
jgi:hypothetical protein